MEDVQIQERRDAWISTNGPHLLLRSVSFSFSSPRSNLDLVFTGQLIAGVNTTTHTSDT
jgi:hypothetical protein